MTTLTPTVCWGAKGHAKVLREFLQKIGFDIVACFDNDPRATSPFFDVPLVGDASAFDDWRSAHSNVGACVVAIGGKSGAVRLEIQRRLAASGLAPVLAVHPTSFVAANASLGPGTQVLAMAGVCAEARLGEACIVNTRASVDHECILGDGVHIGPGATLCGEVRVDDFAFVGAGATILPRVHIGRGAIVGAGALVTREVRSGACVVGVPARETRGDNAD
jgi:sugar O-acyltransferase (sialic acid O-acetyltransferase NeuD family)